MNPKTTAILLVLLAVVGVGYFLLTRSGAPSNAIPTTTAPARPGQPLLPPPWNDADAISQLRVTREGEAATFEKTPEGWIQIEPVQYPLDVAAARDLLDAVTSLRRVETLQPGEGGNPKLEQLGLEPPQTTVTVLSGVSAGPTVELGRRSIAGRAYVKLAGEPTVFVVSDTLHEQLLDRPLRELRRRTLPLPSAAQAEQISIAADGERIALQRIEGDWRFEQGTQGRPSEEAVAQLLAELGNVRVQHFISDRPADVKAYGLDRPRQQVVVSQPLPGGDSRSQTLSIGAPADLDQTRYYASLGPENEPASVVFTLSRTDVERLRRTRDQLRDPRLFATAPSALQELVVERPGLRTIHLRRDSGGFGFASPSPGFAADAQLAQELVERVANASATGYLPDYLPKADPLATIRVTTPTIADAEEVRIYPPVEPDAGYLAIPRGSDLAYRINPAAMSGVFEPLVNLRSRKVAEVNPQQVASVQLHQPDGSSYSFSRNEENRLTLDDAAPFEQETLDDLLRELRPLQASRWMTQPVNLPPETLTLSIGMEDRDSPLVLDVDPDTRQATLTGVDGGFVIGQRLLDLLRAEYRRRTVIPETAEQIIRVTASRGSQSLTVERDLTGGYSSSPARQEADQAKLVNSLAGLRVQRYLNDVPPPDVPGIEVVVETLGQARYALTLRPPGAVAASTITNADGEVRAFEVSPTTYQVLDELVPTASPTTQPAR